MGVDILVDRSLQSYRNIVNNGNWHPCLLYLSELLETLSAVEVEFISIVPENFLTVEVDIHIDRSFQTDQNFVNCGS